tara:strand:+ start:82669 stop:82866 length:198 start_codon:yes stop_codon:yes gene_type:complete
MYKQTYKGFTLFVNDTHFGIEQLVKGNTTYLEYKLPVQERYSLEDYIAFLKLRIDLGEYTYETLK